MLVCSGSYFFHIGYSLSVDTYEVDLSYAPELWIECAQLETMNLKSSTGVFPVTKVLLYSMQSCPSHNCRSSGLLSKYPDNILRYEKV